MRARSRGRASLSNRTRPRPSFWRGVTRRELSGKRGETQGFHVRYFEIAPGGYSTLEWHEHVVIPIRGRGEVQLDCYVYRVGFGDVVYVAPNDPHQFREPAGAVEPFGFMCIVNAETGYPNACVRARRVLHLRVGLPARSFTVS